MEFNREANLNWLKGNGAVSNETLAALQEFDLVNAGKSPLDRAKLKKQKGLPLNAAEFDALESDAKQREGNKETGGAALNGLGIISNKRKSKGNLLLNLLDNTDEIKTGVNVDSKVKEKKDLDRKQKVEEIFSIEKNKDISFNDKFDKILKDLRSFSAEQEFSSNEERDMFVIEVAKKLAISMNLNNTSYSKNSLHPISVNGDLQLDQNSIDCIGFISLVAYATNISYSNGGKQSMYNNGFLLNQPSNLTKEETQTREQEEAYMRNGGGKYYGGVQNARYMGRYFEPINGDGKIPAVGSIGMIMENVNNKGDTSDHIYMVLGIDLKSKTMLIAESSPYSKNKSGPVVREISFKSYNRYYDTKSKFFRFKYER